MKKEKALLLAVRGVLLIALVVLITLCGNSCLDAISNIVDNLADPDRYYDYTGWKVVEIPTESALKATIRIPEEWSFVVENGRIKIKDTDGNIIATECYEGWRIDYSKGGVHYDNKGDMDINVELPEYYRDLDNYKLEQGVEPPCMLYKITDGTVTSYALLMHIMTENSVEGVYSEALVFDSSINDKQFFKKIQISYVFGGHAK